MTGRRTSISTVPAVKLAGLFIAGSMLGAACARAEVIEAIVARVNDDVITTSELKESEQQVVAEIYSKEKGADLDRELGRAKVELLKDLITKRLLVQQAERLYDIGKISDVFMREFKESQKITSNSELEKLLKGEGMTLEEFRKKLVEVNAPGSVIQYEVRDKVAVSDGEIEAYYKEHAKETASPGRASFREIVLFMEGRSHEETLVLAKSIAQKARAGAEFTELARESSEVEPSLRGLILGPFKHGELAPELEQVVFEIKPGEIADPIEVGPALHIVRLEVREEPSTPTLDTLREKITETLERQKFNANLNDYILGLWGKSEIRVREEYVERLPVEFRKFLKD